MTLEIDNETWLIETGDAVIKKKATGVVALSPLEWLIYCLWVADYGMRNAGDLHTARDLYQPFQHQAAEIAKQLELGFTRESFALPAPLLAAEYFQRFDRICEEIKNSQSAH